MALTDLFVGLVRKEKVVAREGERGNVSEPFPADRHGGREPGIEGGHDPCRAACRYSSRSVVLSCGVCIRRSVGAMPARRTGGETDR